MYQLLVLLLIALCVGEPTLKKGRRGKGGRKGAFSNLFSNEFNSWIELGKRLANGTILFAGDTLHP